MTLKCVNIVESSLTRSLATHNIKCMDWDREIDILGKYLQQEIKKTFSSLQSFTSLQVLFKGIVIFQNTHLLVRVKQFGIKLLS